MTVKCPKCQFENPDDTYFCGKCASSLKPAGEILQTKTILKPDGELVIGSLFAGRYKILEVLGSGGMGIVYQVEDTKLKRHVALKFLPPELSRDSEFRERFMREAQAAAALSHANICTIHEVDEEDETSFITMEYIKGQTLRERIAKGPLEIDEALNIATQIAEALEEAHKKAIIHRDIKSANIMVTEKGQAKIMDFGLAKVAGAALITKEARTMGTVAYMSPEQARGEEVDHRTDLWALGVVLYEMFSGRLPFLGDNEASVLYNIEHKEPLPIRKFKSDIPDELEKIIYRSLSKKPESRYQSAGDVLSDLKEYHSILKAPEIGITDFKSFIRFVKKPRIAIPAVAVIMAVGLVTAWFLDSQTKIRWATEEAIPDIERLVHEDDYTAAYQLAEKAEKYIPENPFFKDLWPEISFHVSIDTTPTGADVYCRKYASIDGDWTYLGQIPVESKRMPHAFFRWKISKKGFQPLELGLWTTSRKMSFQLDESGTLPPEMIRVMYGRWASFPRDIDFLSSIQLEPFLIDRYEVTNKQFQVFVDAGGYEKPEYWKHPFLRNGQTLSWEEAMAEFQDITGRPGPSTWEVGHYPEGEDDYPVRGISWYEAAAFAEFSDKSLPTILHWYWAAGIRYSTNIIPLSNFSDESVASVGSYRAISPWGAYDMAGNVREWCWNQSGDLRYILGGCWMDEDYMFSRHFALSPFDRSPANGFRCVRYLDKDQIPEKALESVERVYRDFYKEEPLSEEAFQFMKRLVSYEKTPLNPAIEYSDESSRHWIKQKITFDAAYDNDRMIAYLFVPKGYKPPHQVIVYFPGASAFEGVTDSTRLHQMSRLDSIIKDGRVVVYPIYISSYERSQNIGDDWELNPNLRREIGIKIIKDLSRSIDYLETREDIDSEKLAFYGFSGGAQNAPIFLTLENRIKLGIFELGGFPPEKYPPEIDTVKYVSRLKVPVLMLNGRYDHRFPYERAAKPMFDLLGTPDEHKSQILYDSAHDTPNKVRERDILAWLDKYFGRPSK